LLAALAAMFARLPPSSSYLAERKSVVPPLLLQIGGANIENSPLSSSLGSVLWWAGEPSVRWR
jgi:hypothetical protein